MTKGNIISGVNPQILKWAREKSGYSLQEVADIFGKDELVIQDWEEGNQSLTYSQLEKLAYQVYKRPIAVFFFPIPPREGDPKKSFRTMPDFEIENLSHDSILAIREARAMQISLKELHEGEDISAKQFLKEVQITKESDLKKAAQITREYLGVQIEDQMKWKSKDDPLKKWRDAVQEAGVYIFRRPMSQTEVSGFCLTDLEFPIIYLNSSTSSGRQVFTIFHELAHILLGTNGLTKKNDQYIDNLTGDNRKIEIFCNRFAAELLVPNEVFLHEIRNKEITEPNIEALSKIFKVSREVILRRYLDNGFISSDHYSAWTDNWHKEYQDHKAEKGGRGSYYINQASYLGDKYINLALNRYRKGLCSVEQLASYLNIKTKNLNKFESAFLGGK